MKARPLIRLLLFTMCIIFSNAYAAVHLKLTKGISAAMPIAVIPFVEEEKLTAEEHVSPVIAEDLRNSGRFRLVPVKGIPTDNEELTASLGRKEWRKLNIDNLIVGKIQPLGFRQRLVSVQLLDPIGNHKILLNKQYQVDKADLRQLAHHISDQIYQQLLGARGIFSTRIAYVLNRQNNSRNPYVLEISDADGYNARPILTSPDPIMSPVWSPDGTRLAYVSFENKRSNIFISNIATGKRRLVTSFPGINGAPAWSPDGKQLAMVLSKTGYPKIYTIDLETEKLTQLTHGVSIDTEPNFAPDGKSLIFTSNRGGSPQIYRYDLAKKTIERLTFTGNYNARASHTSDGKQLVMLHREKRQFNIAMQDLKTGYVFTLTRSGHTESPSLAPNNQLILYTSRQGKNSILNLASTDGRIHVRLPARGGDVQEPAWSPFLSKNYNPLINKRKT